MSDIVRPQLSIVDETVETLLRGGLDPTDVCGALLVAAHAIAMRQLGAERWAKALEKSLAAARAPDVSTERQ